MSSQKHCFRSPLLGDCGLQGPPPQTAHPLTLSYTLHLKRTGLCDGMAKKAGKCAFLTAVLRTVFGPAPNCQTGYSGINRICDPLRVGPLMAHCLSLACGKFKSILPVESIAPIFWPHPSGLADPGKESYARGSEPSLLEAWAE